VSFIILTDRFPLCYKDISFWNDELAVVHDNDFCDLVREVAGDLVETVVLSVFNYMP
jgi:phenylalanyl-tRNA synthetase alpha chain